MAADEERWNRRRTLGAGWDALTRRPALVAGLLLALGQALGLCLDGQSPEGPFPGPILRRLGADPGLAFGGLAAGVAGAALVGAGRVRWALAAAAAAALLGAAARTGSSVGGTDARGGPLALERGADAGQVERLGTDRARLAGDRASGWRLAFEGPPPADGERVVLLPPGEFRPRVVGPEPEPRAADRGTRVVGADELVRLVAAERGPLPRWLERAADWGRGLRRGIVARADACGASGSTGLAPALLVGIREDLDPAVADLFTRTGTRHLLALSGLHVGLLAITVLGPLARGLGAAARRLGLGPRGARRLDVGLRILGVAAFALVAGGSPPVVRAALALAAGALAAHVRPPAGGDELTEGRRPDGLSIWGAALTLECLAEPRAVESLSVSLSYAATLGILVLAAPLTRRLALGSGRERRRRQVLRWYRSRPRLVLAIALERGARVLRASVACSLAAVFATLPLAWARFGEVAPAGVLATVAAAPAIGLLLVLDWLAVLGGWPLVTAAIRTVEDGLLGLLLHVDGWPWTPVQLPPRPLWLLFPASAAAGLTLAFARGRVALLALAVLVALGVDGQRSVDALQVELLDVGHGTCALVRIPGVPPIVFDAGARDRPGIVSSGLAPVVRRRGWRRAVVVLSHDDRDHWSGLPWLSSRVGVELWLGARPRGADRSERPPRRFDVTLGPTEAAGRARIDLEGGGRLILLRGSAEPGNEGSRSLIVEWRGRRVLLCGDAVDGGLEASLRAGDYDGPFDLVLLPHHGGHGSGVGRLLDRARPERVWISATGRPPLADELDRRRLDWSATGIDGPLSLRALPRPRAPAPRLADAPEAGPERGSPKDNDPRDPASVPP